MKKIALLILISIASFVAQAESKSYQCDDQVRIELNVQSVGHLQAVKDVRILVGPWQGLYTPLGDGFGFRLPTQTGVELFLDKNLYMGKSEGEITMPDDSILRCSEVTYQMDCSTDIRDIVIRYSDSYKNLEINYSVSGARQDDWVGPFPGKFKSEVNADVFTFSDGTELHLNSLLGNQQGTIVVGNGQSLQQEVVHCRTPSVIKRTDLPE